ncbi:helix-turn-helix domain-containing protein [Methylobacterium sp. WL9]|nr:helix-turn-helix domain-containing protein [Methylobacterium sp. WL9]
MLSRQNPTVEQFFTIKKAAELLGIHYWQLLRLVNSQSLPVYTFGNTRRRVRLSEIVAYIEATRNGGVK